jgi:hypothetical protein
MKAHMSTHSELTRIVNNFTARIVSIVDSAAQQRLQGVINAALGMPARRGPGRPPKTLFGVVSVGTVDAGPRRKRVKVLCPVPGCKGVAAPVFGMVCAKHKDVAKSKIRKYRKARREQAARQ